MPATLIDASDSRPGPTSVPRGAAGTVRQVAGWLVMLLVGVIVVLYALTPLFQTRDQHRLIERYAAVVKNFSLEDTGLYGVQLPTQPPATGSSVGILEIGHLKLQEVVVEGVGPAQTEEGPGHVPGTAGLGQPGNAAVVARRSAFGGPFSDLASVRVGQDIVVTTIEGQSLYVVTQVRSTRIVAGTGVSATAALGGTTAAPVAPKTIGSSVGIEDLFAPSTNNRLTLVTSGSRTPWNTRSAIVVVAQMKGLPFTPTPQQARSASQDGRSAASGTAPLLILALIVFALAAAGSVVIWRRSSIRTAYLVTVAPLVVATVLVAVAVSRTLPAWT
jgi:sortase A